MDSSNSIDKPPAKREQLPPRRASQDRSKKTESQLLDALERLLANKSFDELTVAAIASEAGVTTGAIYRRFKDKNDLLLAAFDRFLERTRKGNADSSRINGRRTNQEIVRFAIANTLEFTMKNLPIMRAASMLNQQQPFDRMREARNEAADSIANQLSVRSLDTNELKRRTRFAFRVVTAVIRDTYLSPTPATRKLRKTKKEREDQERLIDNLSGMAVQYLCI